MKTAIVKPLNSGDSKRRERNRTVLKIERKIKNTEYPTEEETCLHNPQTRPFECNRMQINKPPEL
jgi:hypothetical protein